MRTTTMDLRTGLITGMISLMILAGCGASTSGAAKHSNGSTATTSADTEPDTTVTDSTTATTEPAATTTVSATSSTTPVTTKGGVKTNAETDWSTPATAYNEEPVGTKVRFSCPANGTANTVWGSGPYTADSSVCTAAVHTGAITLAKGGSVVIQTAGAEQSFSGTEANGVTTGDWAEYDHTFTVVKP